MVDFNNAVLQEDQLEANSDGQKQQELSRRIDARISHTIKAAAALSDHARHAMSCPLGSHRRSTRRQLVTHHAIARD
jgi:hypothetical protein